MCMFMCMFPNFMLNLVLLGFEGEQLVRFSQLTDENIVLLPILKQVIDYKESLGIEPQMLDQRVEVSELIGYTMLFVELLQAHKPIPNLLGQDLTH